MDWVFLIVGAFIAAIANIVLKQSDGFNNISLGVLSFLFFGISTYLYGVSLRVIPLGVAYAIWSGVGITVVTIIGFLWFKQEITPLSMLFMAMVLFGCIGLNLVTKA